MARELGLVEFELLGQRPGNRRTLLHPLQIILHRRIFREVDHRRRDTPVQHGGEIGVRHAEMIEQEFAAPRDICRGSRAARIIFAACTTSPRPARPCSREVRTGPCAARCRQSRAIDAAGCVRLPSAAEMPAFGKRSATYCRIAAFSVSTVPSSVRRAGTKPSGLTLRKSEPSLLPLGLGVDLDIAGVRA